MIEFAGTAANWKDDSNWRRHYEELWVHLMGLEPTPLWADIHKLLVVSMRDAYQQWAAKSLDDAGSALVFAHFLQNPAADGIRLEGIVWLNQAKFSLKHGGRYGKPIEVIPGLLAKSWQHHATLIKSDPAAFEAFKGLVHKLAELQNPIALELGDQMRGS